MGKIERLSEREKQKSLWPTDPEFPRGFTEDGRMPVKELYKTFNRLEEEFGWIKEIIYVQELQTPNGLLKFPMEVYRTPLRGLSWCSIAGVHGEEPAGPVALAKSIDFIGDLGRKIPMVVYPVCNPSGYYRDWRYPNEYRDKNKGESVGDSEFRLLDFNSSTPRPRKPIWGCLEAYYLTQRMIELLNIYPPLICIDHHEDECLDYPYIYSQGKMEAEDPIAKEIVAILKSNGLPIMSSGITRFGERVLDGVVWCEHDGSLEELLAAEEVFSGGELIRKNPVSHVFTEETPTLHAPLEKRVAAKIEIIQNFPRFWEMANLMKSEG